MPAINNLDGDALGLEEIDGRAVTQAGGLLKIVQGLFLLAEAFAGHAAEVIELGIARGQGHGLAIIIDGLVQVADFLVRDGSIEVCPLVVRIKADGPGKGPS